MKRLLSLLTIFALIIPITLSGCNRDSNKSVSKSGFYFDTIITITLYGTEDQSLINSCFDIASTYERMFSNNIENSDVSKINQNAGKKYVEVNQETIYLLNKSIEYGKISDGSFDVTIGKLVDLWDISNLSKTTQNDENIASENIIPPKDDINSILEHVDYSKIKIKDNKVKLMDSMAKIDLGAIAKGYIADKLKEYLMSQGVSSGIISLGGNVLTIGNKTNGSDFSVGIQKPFAEAGELYGTLKVTDKSVVTSGIYERYVKIDDKIYHHILDSKTGYPCDNNLYSVTIISDKSVDGDALSTLCFTLGLDKGLELIEKTPGIEAIFITNEMKSYCSSGIGDKIVFEE